MRESKRVIEREREGERGGREKNRESEKRGRERNYYKSNRVNSEPRGS